MKQDFKALKRHEPLYQAYQEKLQGCFFVEKKSAARRAVFPVVNNRTRIPPDKFVFSNRYDHWNDDLNPSSERIVTPTEAKRLLHTRAYEALWPAPVNVALGMGGVIGGMLVGPVAGALAAIPVVGGAGFLAWGVFQLWDAVSCFMRARSVDHEFEELKAVRRVWKEREDKLRASLLRTAPAPSANH